MRCFIKFAYKGTCYHGWQYQPNAVSVQEVLTDAFQKITRRAVSIVGAGRTDTGVHAREMYAHFETDDPVAQDPQFIYKINSALPSDIVVAKVFAVSDEAHARFSATSRSYEYRIYCGRNPFLLETTWQIFHQQLNVPKMNEAARFLLGNQDFKCFARTGGDVKHYRCDVTEATWVQKGKHLTFYISADRFLRNMVRAIVGTLVEIGKNRWQADDLQKIIAGKDRSMAGASAPAKGLFLSKICYPKTIVND